MERGKDGTLVSATPHRAVANGDLYTVETQRGTYVFAPGPYTVRVSDPETGRLKELRGLASGTGDDRSIEVVL